MVPYISTLPAECTHIIAPYFCNELIRYCTSAAQHFNNSGLSPDLFYTDDALYVARPKADCPPLDSFKHTAYFLILYFMDNSNEKLCAIGLSDHEAAHFQKECIAFIQNGLKEGIPTHKLMLVNSQGKVVQNGPRQYGFEENHKRSILNSNGYQVLMSHAGLLNGQLLFPQKIIERLPRWKGFRTLWQRIRKSATNPEALHTAAIEKMIKANNAPT
jgi:hypothetical protein